MTVPNWTPGPWCYENIGEKENCYAIGVGWRVGDETFTQVGGPIRSYDDNGNEVMERSAVCFIEDGSHSTDGSLHADACLIAAAPELYNALADMLRHCERQFIGWPSSLGEVDCRNRVVAALAKARGENVVDKSR